MFDNVGVDATRLQFCVNEPGDQKRFSLNLVNQQVMPFLTILWNSYQYSKNISSTKKPELQIEDKWILSRINTLVNEITQELEKHNYHKCFSLFIQFVNEDLSRTYIKLIRDRADNNDTTIGYVFNYVFERLSKLLAPFAPYISDYIYQSLENKSVHLSEWPLADKKLINIKIETDMIHAKNIIQGILSERTNEQIGVRWPLPEVVINIKNTNESLISSIKTLEDLIKKQVNCKKIIVKKKPLDKEFEVKLNTKLTPELEKEGYTREVLRRIQDLRKKAKLNKQDKIEIYINSKIDLDFKLIEKTANAEIIKNFKATFADKFKIKEKEFEIGIKKI